MESHLTAITLILFATSYVLSGCVAEGHLVPKHGLEPLHRIAKRDLSQADMEMILKALMLKLDHKEPEIHYAGVKEDEMKYAAMSQPEEYEYLKEALPHEASEYEIKKGVEDEEKEMKAFSIKLKDLGIGKDAEESYGKEAYLEAPEEKFKIEKVYLSKDPVVEQSGKVFEDELKDKFSDKEVSKAESLYHMKIAGDVETYPHFKMEPLHELRKADEKLHEKIGTEETFLKKVDELGKTLLKEEDLKKGDIEAYLKKVAEEEKTRLYVPEEAHAESHIKSTEEKAVEAWKASHKDLFIAEEKLQEEKLRKELGHHKEEGIAIGMNDELIKKIKTFDEELAKEHDELLHTLAGKTHQDELIAEGTTAYEKAKEQAHKDAAIYLTDEELKKYIDEALAFGAKEKGLDADALFGKGLVKEGVHKIDTKYGSGIEKSLHGISDEEAFKIKEAHALDKAYGFEVEKAKFGGKVPLFEDEFKHAVSREIAGEAEKTFKIHDDEYLKKEIAHGTDAFLHKGHDEELFKKEKSLGSDAFLHKAFEDELIKKDEAIRKGEFFHKAHEEDLIKGKGYDDEDFHHKILEEELLKKEKAFDSDAFLHKAHEDELLKKEKAFDVDSFLYKAHEDELLKKEKTFDADDFLRKTDEEDLLKKEKAFDVDAFLHKANKDELLKEKSFDVDAGLHKAHEDELIKKEIAYGTDALFHKGKGIAAAADDHHVLKEKSHKTIHDLKAKFLELLRRVLHVRKCHLVTMRPGELLGIVNCISRSKDPLLCEKFSMCEKKMPPRVLATLEKCQKEIVPGEVKRCTRYAPLYPTAEIPLKIFQCVAINTGELKPEEKKMMIEFEECAKVVKDESCARFKFFSH